MSTPNGGLPEGWNSAKLSELGTWVGGGTPSKKEPTYWEGGTVPWVSPKDMKSLCLEGTENRITPLAVDESAVHLFPANSIAVVVRSGILSRTLPIALVPFEATANQDMRVLTPAPDLNPEWVLWFLVAASENIRRKCQKHGTTVASIEVPRMQEYTIPVPPREEQDRIVAAVEAALSQVDAGSASFGHTFQSAQLYERSLYSEAFSGGLSSMLPNGETPDALLSRLGVTTLPQAAHHPDWPAHWRAARLGDLASRVTSGSRDWKPSYGRGTGVFVLTQSVRMRRLDLSDPFHVDPPKDDPARVRSAIARDDILVTIVGANVGNTARVPVDVSEHYVCQSLALIRPRERLMSQYLELYLAAPNGGQRFFEACFYGQGRPHISFADIKRMPVPVPSLEEQSVIVASFDRQAAALDAFRASMESGLQQADSLRQSVLHHAFTGQLVQQLNKRRPVPVAEQS